jgi:ABC-type glycerol-3-phosphate transport system substrate-binding protein
MRKIVPLGILAALIIVGAGCALLPGPQVQLKPITLEYWRIQDSPDTMKDAIAAYEKLHPNVTVDYKLIDENNYDTTLLTAFAENKGPDIFSIPNVWLGEWESKIQPMPTETDVATETVNAQKQIVTSIVKKPTISLIDFDNDYVDGVAKELVVPIVDKPGQPATDKIIGLPLSADTLALYYNVDILKKSTITAPPQSWRDFQQDATQLTILESATTNTNSPAAAAGGPATGAEELTPAGTTAAAALQPNVSAPSSGGTTPPAIKQSGAAIGLADNVDYATDILSALMMQNGAQMSDDSGFATFGSFTPATSGMVNPPGVEALMFYQSFAIPTSQNYTWNETMPMSLDAFVNGTTAFYFGLPSDAAKIRERAPTLNFAIAPLPQVDPTNPQNILHYPVEVVSKKTLHPDEAWDFLQFLAGPDQVAGFLNATKRPAALRSLISGQLTDPDVAAFAGQVLTAKSWYHGQDYGKVDAAFATMITAYPTFKNPAYAPIVAAAVNAVNQTVTGQQ